MKLRVGLVGLGDAWETRHLPALRALSDRFEVRAVCADVALMAQRAAQQFNCNAVDGFRVLTAREDIDAILMLSPQWYGPLPILAACEHQKSVYCAAALELELDQAQLVTERVTNAGIAFMAEFPRRHAAATLRLKELIATNLGKPQLVFCHFRSGIPEVTGPSRSKATRTRVKRDLIELVDWCRYVVGQEPTSVVGIDYCPNEVGPEGQYRMISLDFSGNGQPALGPTAQISSGHYLPAPWTEAINFRPPAAMQVRCENGVAFIDLPASLVWFDQAGRHMESLETERPLGEQLLSLFHRSVTSLVRRTNDLEDAYRALSIVLTAEESSRQGKRLML